MGRFSTYSLPHGAHPHDPNPCSTAAAEASAAQLTGSATTYTVCISAATREAFHAPEIRRQADMGGAIMRPDSGMDFVRREQRAEEKGGGIPPSGTSGFSWRNILLAVLLLGAIVAVIVFVLPLLVR